jgi:streptogramin lyase
MKLRKRLVICLLIIALLVGISITASASDTGALSSIASVQSICNQGYHIDGGYGTVDTPYNATVVVSNGVSLIRPIDIKVNSYATMFYYGTDSTYSTIEIDDVNLLAGTYKYIYIKVQAEDGTSKYYMISVFRNGNSNAYISSVLGYNVLALGGLGTLSSPAYEALEVHDENIQATDISTSDPNAMLIFYGSDSDYQNASYTETLTPGAVKDIFIKVISADKSTVFYHQIRITRTPSSDATLSTILGSKIPRFGGGDGNSSSWPITANLYVDHSTESITASDIIPSGFGATVYFAGTNSNFITSAISTPLIAGIPKTVYFRITSQSLSNSQYYAITIIRIKPPSSTITFNKYTLGNTGNLIKIDGISDLVVSAGRVFVTDYNNGRIVEYDEAGNYVAFYGTKGSGLNKFTKPLGISVDENGYIYVADSGNNRIVRFLPVTGQITEWQTFGTLGSGAGQLKKPLGVFVKNGTVYVTDTGNSRVVTFNTAGGIWQAYGTKGSGDGQFYNLYDIVTDDAGNMWVSDTMNSRVVKLDASGNFVTVYTGYSMPYGLAIDGYGNVFVADRQTGYIQCVNGSVIYGGKGAGTGKFKNPVGLFISSDNILWVVDITSAKIQNAQITY